MAHSSSKGNLEAFETLWIMANKSELYSDDLFLLQLMEGSTVHHIAAQENPVAKLQKMRGFVEECQPNSKEIITNLLLSKNKQGMNCYVSRSRRIRRGI